jgi:hypothetical protein
VDELQLQKGWRERWGKTPPLMSVLGMRGRKEDFVLCSYHFQLKPLAGSDSLSITAGSWLEPALFVTAGLWLEPIVVPQSLSDFEVMNQ